ncbi:type II toxin-antitoxin system RelE/ParE family toxin [Methyloparacoccus murrellii]
MFTRFAADCLDEDELMDLQRHLDANPHAGPVVPGTGGVRKLRWSRPGMGKRGGLRILYYVQDQHGRIWLLTVHGKSAQENISPTTLRTLREIADHAEII